MKGNKGFYYGDWLLHDTWSFNEACYLLLEEDPDYVNQIYPPNDEVHEAAENIHRMARSCEALSLDVVIGTYQSACARVRPIIFVQWAEKKGLCVPDFMKHLLNENQKESSDKLNNVKKISMRQRVVIIGQTAEKLFSDPLNIEDGGKTEIWEFLKDNTYKSLKRASFNSDWTEAKIKKLVRMKNNDSFTKAK